MAREKSAPSSATVGFEAKLWLAADKRCDNMDVVEKLLRSVAAL